MAATIHRRVPVLILLTALALTTLVGRGQPADALDPGVSHVYIADGRNFPDALVGSVLAAAEGVPILTVNTGSIPAFTATELERLDPIDRIIVLGGPAAVSADVFEALGQYTTPPGNVERLAGEDRFETATKISAALPSKVHDADRLDGIDSSDFSKIQRWEYVSVPAAAWSPDVENRDHLFNHSRGSLKVLSSTGCFQAPLWLPDGARIDQVTLFALDNEANDVEVRLTRHAHDSTSSSNSTPVSTAGASTAMQEVSISPVAASWTVDNQTFSYYLTTCMGSGQLELYDVLLRLDPVN